jgi:hypothetical protein
MHFHKHVCASLLASWLAPLAPHVVAADLFAVLALHLLLQTKQVYA